MPHSPTKGFVRCASGLSPPLTKTRMTCDPDMLFDVLDRNDRPAHPPLHQEVLSQRRDSRHGRPGHSVSPNPKSNKSEYSLDAVLPGFFDDFAEALAPDEGRSETDFGLVTGHRATGMNPTRKPINAKPPWSVYSDPACSSASSLRVNAFARTAERMADSHDQFLAAMDRGGCPQLQGAG